MNGAVFIGIVAVFGLASSTSLFDGGRTFFKHREKPVVRRAPLMSEDGQNLQDMSTRWLKRYYHERNGAAEEPESLQKYRFVEPSSIQWLMDNILDTSQDPKSFQPAQEPVSSMKTDGQPQLLSDEIENDLPEYSDIYGMASALNSQDPVDSPFQKALAHYLMQSNTQEENDQKSGGIENSEASMKQVSESQKTDADATTPSSSSPTVTPSPSDLLSDTTVPPISPTLPSNSLSAVPPVHLGKGQKEYAMLRPASENSRKFENWAENFQKSLLGPSKDIEQMLRGFSSNKFTRDRFAEQLDKLKVRSRRDVNAAEIILY